MPPILRRPDTIWQLEDAVRVCASDRGQPSVRVVAAFTLDGLMLNIMHTCSSFKHNGYIHSAGAAPARAAIAARYTLPTAPITADVRVRKPARVRHSVAIYGQQRMCMREKAWFAASVSLRLARLPPLQAGSGARVAYAPRFRLRQAFSRMLLSQNSKN